MQRNILMRAHDLLRQVWFLIYKFTLILFWPANKALSFWGRDWYRPESVLHISAMVHIPYQTTRVLRAAGIDADYLATSRGGHWNKSDLISPWSWVPFLQVLLEFVLFWRVVARYQIFHLHFGRTMTKNGWELPILRKMGRRIIIHYRGCEIRDYFKNIALHPRQNICQECDYGRSCISDINLRRVRHATRFGDAFLVTTPDLFDFVPDAIHIPFFCPEEAPDTGRASDRARNSKTLRVLHWTNHPGIEGTREIEAAIESLKARDYPIELVILKDVPYRRVLEEIAQSDLTIGKMKMGYYANSQIEAMAYGVPTITWVRPEFMTEDLRQSGFIFCELDNLASTLEFYLENRDKLSEKRAKARSSILKLHNNDAIAEKYRQIYFGQSSTHRISKSA